MPETPNTIAQVAECPNCTGSIMIAAAEIQFDKDTLEEFASLLMQGYVIKRCTLEYARANKWCECGEDKKTVAPKPKTGRYLPGGLQTMGNDVDWNT